MKQYAKQFRISTAKYRSKQWYKERAGKPTASGLGRFLDTLKDGTTPSARARKYLFELAYERHFETTYDTFVTQPMIDGVTYEDFAKQLYIEHTGNSLEEARSFVSDWFVATPDAIVWEKITLHRVSRTSPRFNTATGLLVDTAGKKGLLECKVVGDKTFSDIMENGIPLDHELQMQGQLMASGLDWCDYIVVNLKTKAYMVFRLARNNKLIKRIYERLHEPLELPELNVESVRRFNESLLQNYEKGIEKPELNNNLPF